MRNVVRVAILRLRDDVKNAVRSNFCNFIFQKEKTSWIVPNFSDKPLCSMKSISRLNWVFTKVDFHSTTDFSKGFVKQVFFDSQKHYYFLKFSPDENSGQIFELLLYLWNRENVKVCNFQLISFGLDLLSFLSFWRIDLIFFGWDCSFTSRVLMRKQA